MKDGDQTVDKGDLQATYEAVVHSYNHNEDERALGLLEILGEMAPHNSFHRKHFFYFKINIVGFRRQRYAEALLLCDQALAAFPRYRELCFLKGQMLLEVGEPRKAFFAFHRSFKLAPDHANSAYEMAKILHRAKRRRMAVRMADRARDLGATVTHLYEILAFNHFPLGQPHACIAYVRLLEALGTTNSHLDYLKALSTTAVEINERLRRRPRLPTPRHIAIGSAPYVGSTLLGTLLGSLPGVVHAGETQELTHRFDWEQKIAIPIDFKRDPLTSYNHCRLCGPECRVFNHDFRLKLSRDPIDFYSQVGRRLKSEILITSDKLLTEYMGKDPLFRYDLIVLYKPPETWIRSYARQEADLVATGLVQDGERGTVGQWLEQWVRTYSDLLETPVPAERTVVVNWDRFVAHPERGFDRLVRRLRLPGNASVFSNLKIGHFVGGNTTGNLRDVIRSGRVTFKTSDAPPLSKPEEAAVRDDPVVQRLSRKLDRRHFEVFGDLGAPANVARLAPRSAPAPKRRRARAGAR